jgi:hypothetical protein
MLDKAIGDFLQRRPARPERGDIKKAGYSTSKIGDAMRNGCRICNVFSFLILQKIDRSCVSQEPVYFIAFKIHYCRFQSLRHNRIKDLLKGTDYARRYS